MPIDPGISLQVGGGGAINPLGMVGAYAQIQNQLNQNRLFQQTFAARQMAGQILASAPDMESGAAMLAKNPITAPFAPEIVNSIRQLELTNTEIAGKQQEMSDSGLKSVVLGMAGGYSDPASVPKLVQAKLATLSPVARERVTPAIATILESLTDGLPSDPTAASAMYKQRYAALLLSSGMTAENLKGLVGTPTTVEAGGRKYLGVQAPAQAGGAFAPSTEIGMSLAPTALAGPGAVPIAMGGSPVGVQQLGGGPSIPQSGGQMGPSSPRGAPSAPTGGTPGGQSGFSPISPPPMAGDGRPLLPAKMIAPSSGKGGGGLQLLSPAQLKQADNLQNEYSGEGQKSYEMAVQSMASLRYMDNALDTLRKGGGFLVPGTLANSRVDLAKAANTFSQILGGKPSFDPEKIASVEEFNKETKRLGLMVINQFLGGQREASQIITGITQSVPNVENSYLGGKLVSAGLQAAAQRIMDERNFEAEWASRNQGNLINAKETFNNLHPAEEYANRVLDQFGMTSKGFRSKEAVGNAFRQGYLTQKQAGDILRNQFGFK